MTPPPRALRVPTAGSSAARLEPGRRIELLTYALRVRCSTD